MALGNIYRYQLISNITENICIAGGWFLLLLNNSRPGKIILYCCTDQFHFLVRFIDMSGNLEEPQRKNQEALMIFVLFSREHIIGIKRGCLLWRKVCFVNWKHCQHAHCNRKTPHFGRSWHQQLGQVREAGESAA